MENGDDEWEAAVVASFHKLALTTLPGLNLDPARMKNANYVSASSIIF